MREPQDPVRPLPIHGESDLFNMNPDDTGLAQGTKTASRENRPQWARGPVIANTAS